MQFVIPMLATFVASIVGIIAHRRRLPPLPFNILVGLLWWLGIAGSQWAITQVPDFTDRGVFFPNQVWQRILWPLGLFVLFSCIVEYFADWFRAKRYEATQLLLYMLATGLTIFVTLPFVPIWEDLIPENTFWLLASLSAAVCNYHLLSLMCDSERKTSGHRWALWLFVANLGAISGVMLSQIGSLGEWCIAAMLGCATLAALVSLTGESTWTKSLLPSICILAACLVSNIRFNATNAKPWWIFLILFSMPSIIAIVDLGLEGRSKKSVRMVVSATLAAVFAITTICFVWLGSSSRNEW